MHPPPGGRRAAPRGLRRVLFIAEALFFDKRVTYHLDFATLAAARPRLACRRLVVTHMGQDMLRRAGGLGVEAAEDGGEIQV